MISEPRISVIVPVYNVEKYVAQCIESILSQTYKNLEIILVDDGSPDKCGHICDNYAVKDPRIVVIHQENKGLSGARNAGLDVATGEYIAFVDSDDYIDSRMIEILYDNLRAHQAKISSCEFIPVYEGKPMETKQEIIAIRELTSEEALACFLISGIVDLVVWNKLYTMDVWGGVRFPDGKVFEDHFTTYKLLDVATKIVHSNEKLYYYRKRRQSISDEPFSSRTADLKIGLEKECRYIRAKYPKIKKEIDLGYMFWLVVIWNKMIKGGIKKDDGFLREVRRSIRTSALGILKCRYFSLTRKVQIFILLFNKELYRMLYFYYIGRFR